MINRICKSAIFAFCLSSLLAAGVNATKLSDNLTFLQPLAGKAWLGHFDNPEDSHFNHHILWEPILGGQAVRATKKVPELEFGMETVYYWDPSEETVRYLSLTSKGQLSTGVVHNESGRIVLHGSNIDKAGGGEYRISFEILTDGTLEDRFYLKSNGEWVQRHLIRYSVNNETK